MTYRCEPLQNLHIRYESLHNLHARCEPLHIRCEPLHITLKLLLASFNLVTDESWVDFYMRDYRDKWKKIRKGMYEIRRNVQY